MPDLVIGADGLARCAWGASTPDYAAYHDTEWGRPVRDDDALYERMTLEAFQSGLSWLTILRKRAAFRVAFADFAIGPGRPVRRGGRGPAARRRRHRPQPGEDRGRDRQRPGRGGPAGRAVRRCCGRSRPTGRRPRPTAFADLPPPRRSRPRWPRTLKRRGFRFVGPTTAYALMQATGMVDDHLAGCHVQPSAART